MTILIGAKSHFSLGESILSPEQLVTEAKRLGYTGIALADNSTINGMPDLYREAKKQGLDAYIGATLHVTDDITWRRPKKGERNVKPQIHQPRVFAKNEHGLRVLMRLLTIAHDENHFYFVPQLSRDDVLDALHTGSLLYTTGGELSALAVRDYSSLLGDVQSALQSEPIYVELPVVATPYYERVRDRGIDYWRAEPITKLLASHPTMYKQGDGAARNTMDAILSRSKVDSRWCNLPVGDLSGKSDLDCQKDMYKFGYGAKVIGECYAGDKEFKTAITYKWEKMAPSLPQMAADPFVTLVDLCKEGWSRRLYKPTLGYQPADTDLPKYKARLAYELRTLRDMGFENYFLLVSDIVNWCKTQEIIVGPGRGSVGGSLVAFLIGITDIDPIRFGLFFERFINPDRLDLPDADLDFMSSRREEVIAYIIKRYGADKVAGISNYNAMHGASCIRQVGSAHNLTEDQISCSKLFPKLHGQPVSMDEAVEQVPEIEWFAINNPQVWKECNVLEGTLRSYGRHAAGVIVANEPILNRAVLENRQGSRTVNWDKRSVEDFGLVKLDILGLQTLDILYIARGYVKARHGIDIVLEDIPLDDAPTLKGFAKGDTVGVFQFESSGMQRLLKQLAGGGAGTLTFEEISAATALYRPGPMDSGLMASYIAIKSGAEYENYLHDNMKPALQETASVIVYQEQVMQISRDLAGFTMTEADHLRKAMGKKDKDAMAEQREKWVDGCLATSGVARSQAEALFDQIEKFAGYGFNKSHSVEYSVISYWSMWFKTNYPAEFLAAALSILAEDKLPALVRDANARGLRVYPPDVNKSGEVYAIDGARLYAPFQALKGCSEKGAAAIVKARVKAGGSFKSRKDLTDNVDGRACNSRVIERLDQVGAFHCVEAGDDPMSDARLRHQKDLLPGLIVRNVRADRGLTNDAAAKKALISLINVTQSCADCSLAGAAHPPPRLGKTPKFMIVTDCPNWAEDKEGKMGEGAGSEALEKALQAVGLTKADVYITSLVKSAKPKGDQLANEMINGCQKHLAREIEILNPALIVALGTKSFRHLAPDAQGNWEELNGRAFYFPEQDRTVICGLNPMMIHFDGSKQKLLDHVISEAAAMFKTSKAY